MATGDIRNNVRKLQSELKKVGMEYTSEDIDGIIKGKASSFLPIYHHVFVAWSPSLTDLMSNINVELYGKNDLRFMEGIYKSLREIFEYKPPLTREQFFSNGFAERKVIMCTEILRMAAQKHRQLNPKPLASINRSSLSTSAILKKFTSSRVTKQPPSGKTSISSSVNVRPKSTPIRPLVKELVEELRGPSQQAVGASGGTTAPPVGGATLQTTNPVPLEVVGPPDISISHHTATGCRPKQLHVHYNPVQKSETHTRENYFVPKAPKQCLIPKFQDLSSQEDGKTNTRITKLEESVATLTSKMKLESSNQDNVHGHVIIARQDWDSLVARVTLLETRLNMLENVGQLKTPVATPRLSPAGSPAPREDPVKDIQVHTALYPTDNVSVDESLPNLENHNNKRINENEDEGGRCSTPTDDEAPNLCELSLNFVSQNTVEQTNRIQAMMTDTNMMLN